MAVAAPAAARPRPHPPRLLRPQHRLHPVVRSPAAMRGSIAGLRQPHRPPRPHRRLRLPHPRPRTAPISTAAVTVTTGVATTTIAAMTVTTGMAGPATTTVRAMPTTTGLTGITTGAPTIARAGT